MIRLGLIGFPVSHSLSPKIQNAALRACGLEGDYSLFPVESGDRQALQSMLDRVRSGELTGLNVTIPHKQSVIEFLDELAPAARAIGAVNIIYKRDHKLVGDNTDAAGFLKDLNEFIAADRSGIVNRKLAVVLGAGGSARSVVHALLNDGWQVAVTARRLEQAKQLSSAFPDRGVCFTDNVSNIELSAIGLIVNTTPVGMTPNIDQSPLPEALILPRHTMIYDLIYNPNETKLVKDARAQGRHTTTGLGMLIEQATLGFELWTGHRVAREVLYQAIRS